MAIQLAVTRQKKGKNDQKDLTATTLVKTRRQLAPSAIPWQTHLQTEMWNFPKQKRSNSNLEETRGGKKIEVRNLNASENVFPEEKTVAATDG